MAEPRQMPRRGPGAAAMPRPKLDHPGRIFKRTMKYVLKNYAVAYAAVVVCIFVTVVASIKGTMFMQTLIDDYITPLTKAVKAGGTADFYGLGKAIGTIMIYYGCGILASFIQSRLMIYVSQGTMYRFRRDMFTHMESLPIKYFDTHSHGDIMSMYTNDVDTLRQMISQSIPQVFSSLVTIAGVLISMIILSPLLTGLNLVITSSF